MSDKEAELRTYWGDKVAILEHEVCKHTTYVFHEAAYVYIAL